MADVTMKVSAVWDFSALADSFRKAADAFDALQASLTPAEPAAPAATVEESPEIPAEDPQGP